MTARVHGEATARRQREIAEAVFGERVASLPPDRLAELQPELEPWTWPATGAPATVLDLLLASGAFSSRGEARRAVAQGGVSVNDERVTDSAAAPPAPVGGEFYVVRVGKKRTLIGRRSTG